MAVSKRSNRTTTGSAGPRFSKVTSGASVSDTIITTAEAGAEDLQEQIAKLSRRLDKETEKQHRDQRSIFIGVLLAIVLVVATVAAEVIIFNADFRDSLDTSMQQEHQDYKNLRDSVDQNQNSIEQQLFNLKLSQQ